MLCIGVVLFGSLWGLTVLATKTDRAGPSWRVSGLFWLVAGMVITAWAYRDVKPHTHVLQEKFRSALRQNTACEVRVCSNKVIEFENENFRKGWYAFQVDDEQIVFVNAGFCRRSRGFPNSDFSLVDIADEKGNIVAGFVRSHGDRLLPSRTISQREAAGLRIPGHMEIINGNFERIDIVLRVKA
jgi:hypothetical protein